MTGVQLAKVGEARFLGAADERDFARAGVRFDPLECRGGVFGMMEICFFVLVTLGCIALAECARKEYRR